MNVILFDPGGADMSGSCDSTFGPPTVSQVLADWLNSNMHHRLLVLTGRKSEEKPFDYFGDPTFAGLWRYYFNDIWNQPFANQVLVCDYNNMDHGAVLVDFQEVVKSGWTGCPSHRDDPAPVPWHP